MRFNQIIIWATLFSLSACSWIRTEPKSVKTFQSKNLDLSCVKTVPNQLQDLFSGNYTNATQDQEQIAGLFNCIDRALNAFSTYTRGTDTGVYSPKELQQFANRYLPEDNPLSDAFIASIFKIKTDVVGGNQTQLTRQEITGLRNKLNRFGEIIGPIAPYMSALLNPSSTDPRIKHEASIALNKFVINLSTVLSDSENPLPWSDITFFIKELERFTMKGDTSALTLVREQIPIFQYAKLLLVGGNEASIEKEKWKPIFDSISHFYEALFLTSNTTELLEQLSIEVQSTEQEQARAVAQLTGLFKALKLDPTLHSKSSVTLLSDRFAKALLINAVIFPRSQGSLALKPFLETSSLRKLAGYILDQTIHIEVDHIDPTVLQQIGDNVSSLIEQSSISNSPRTGTNEPLTLSKLQDYIQSLEPLFEKKKETETIELGITTLQSTLPLLIGRDGEALNPKDIRQLIQKAIDLYLVWEKTSKKSWTDQVGTSLEIVLRYPSLYSITSTQIKSALSDVQKLITFLKPEDTTPWSKYLDYANKALKAKATLFQTSEFILTSYELNQLAFLYEPFRKNEDLGTSLNALSNLLQIKSFQSANIADLLPIIDSFLPASTGLASRGFTPALIGDLKSILIGGSPKSIARNEYSDLARTLGVFYTNLYSKVKALPPGYKLGLDSNTFDLISAAIRSLIDSKKNPISANDLKSLLQDILKNTNFSVQNTTLDKLLIGVTVRAFHQSKAPKPKSVNGLFFLTSELEPIMKLSEQLSTQFAEIEAAYTGLEVTTDRLSRSELLSKIKSSEVQTVIQSINPILEGKRNGIHFPTKGDLNDQFVRFDLLYKTLVYNTLNWVFPLYKITDDPTQPNSTRISEADMADLLYDIDDLITDLKLTYGTSSPSESARSRMRSINLFTQTGNGDEYVDPIETTEFLTITLGGKQVLSDVSAEVFAKCNPGVTNTDQILEFPVSCLSKVFFQKDFMTRVYGDVAPQLIDQYSKWDAETLEDFRKAALTSALPKWTEEGMFLRSELETFVSVPYYVENLFERFDRNQDDLLQFSEAMAGFPIFCREIKKTGGPSLSGSCEKGKDPGQIEAVYGYLLYRGQAPRGVRRTDSLWQRAKAIKDILGWFNYWKRLDKTPSVRDLYPPRLDRKDLLKIMANLATSTADPAPLEIPQQPEVSASSD